MSLIEVPEVGHVDLDRDVEHAEKLGISQWNLISDLEAEYNNRIVPGCKVLFIDNYWHDYDESTSIESNYINWDNFGALKPAARKLLVKILAIDELEISSLALSTTKNTVKNINRFFQMLERNNILIGDENEPLIGLDTLESSDIERFMDDLAAETPSLGALVSYVTAISKLKACGMKRHKEYPFLYLKADLPWKASDLTPEKWLKRRIAVLGLIEKERKPYKPFGVETTVPLIERSMDILDNYADKAVELFKDGVLCATVHDGNGFPSGRFTDKEKWKHAKKFEGVFDAVLPMTVRPRKGVSGEFYSTLFDLIQGAMMNIVLFTTGIRNSDFRQLKVGCAKPSEADKHLYYIDTRLQKTGNDIHIPIPENAYRAIKILEKIRFSDENEFLLTRYTIKISSALRKLHGLKHGTAGEPRHYLEAYNTNIKADLVNNRLRRFADYFDIPFMGEDGSEDDEGMAHRYRATAAGWLASASKLSVLLVRRLFGHTNNLMPMAYLHHNSNFVHAIEEGKALAAEEMALSLTKGARSGRLGGVKGKQLSRGYEYQRGKSQSASDFELFTDFKEEMRRRILNGTMCGFLTPLSVVCGRNPVDTSPTPCAKKAYKNELAEKAVTRELVDHFSMVRPDQCIGDGCKEAIIGEWSMALRDTFVWYVQLLKGMYQDDFSEEHYKEEAKSFIAQYAEDMLLVFELEVSDV